MRVEVIETPDLGDRSYVVSDGSCAVVVDPQRDVDRVHAVLNRLGVPVVLVLETHLHNDYVTGGHALAEQTGASYVVSGEDEVAFARTAAVDGDELTAGSMTVQVVSTPGHTMTHLSYVISDGAGPPAAFTGGSLLYGSVGRTDLLGEQLTEELTRKQFHSARRLSGLLPNDAPLYPTHGFGSFCSSGGASGGNQSTLGAERSTNDALIETNEQAFVDKLVAGLTGFPSYYAHMGALNARGPGLPDLSAPAPVDPAELAARLRAGEWLVDLRERTAYAGRHLTGTVSVAIGAQFSTYVGWIIPWGAPITLLGETAEQVADAQRQLVRIGIDRLGGAATGTLDQIGGTLPIGSYPVVDFAGLHAAMADRPDAVVLDVRRQDERAHGGLHGSVHLPLDQLDARRAELPAGTLFVHCASGFRASIGASLLHRAGRDVVHIDDVFAHAAEAGLQLTTS